jgi:PAS domain S-box-containing protein
LEESEKGLAEAQKMAQFGNWDWDLVTDKIYWSAEIYRIFGRNPQELLPNYNEFLDYIYPADRDYLDKVIKKALDGKPYNIDRRIVLPSGEERVIHVQTKVTYDEKNIPIRIRGTVQDITQREQTEKALQESEARLHRFSNRV